MESSVLPLVIFENMNFTVFSCFRFSNEGGS